MIKFISNITQNQLKDKTLTYYFLGSYHGHNICDAGAAHAKLGLERKLNATQHTPSSIEEICDIISVIPNHQAFPIHQLTTAINRTTTIDKIRTYHKFEFEDTQIRGYRTSNSPTFTLLT